jgi:hypothetical protein
MKAGLCPEVQAECRLEDDTVSLFQILPELPSGCICLLGIVLLEERIAFHEHQNPLVKAALQ